MTAPCLRPVTLSDVDTVVSILIASKEASFPNTIEDHDRDVSFWTRRWSDYILRGSLPFQPFGDGWVFIGEVDAVPVGYVAYHHTRRLGTDAELQNIYVLKEWQGRGIGTHLLGLIAHRLQRDGSRSICVGYDAKNPYKRFYMKHGAVETEPGSPWAIWRDVPALASRLPPPPAHLMEGIGKRPGPLWPGWLMFR
jgi:GNAT superfamily N-acetyltransferase